MKSCFVRLCCVRAANAARKALPSAFYAKRFQFPVCLRLVVFAPTGPVVVRLCWGRLASPKHMPLCVCVHTPGFFRFISFVPEQYSGRGHRPVLDTCASEAIPRWEEGGLINHLYLQLRPTKNTPKCVASIMGRIVKLTVAAIFLCLVWSCLSSFASARAEPKRVCVCVCVDWRRCRICFVLDSTAVGLQQMGCCCCVGVHWRAVLVLY